MGYVSDLQRVVIIEKNGMKAEFVFEGGTLWTLSASEKNALPRFAEEVKRGLPALEITQEERKKSATGCVIVIVLLLASIPIYAGYKSYNSYMSEHVKTWHDPKSGLTWQNPPSDVRMDLKTATAYCSSLTLDGGSGWRLPTIGELRSLIRGCPAIEVRWQLQHHGRRVFKRRLQNGPIV